MRATAICCVSVSVLLLACVLSSCQFSSKKEPEEQVGLLKKVYLTGFNALPKGSQLKLVVLYKIESTRSEWGSLWKDGKDYFVLSKTNKHQGMVKIDEVRALEILGLASALRSTNRDQHPLADPRNRFGEILVYSILVDGVKLDRVSRHALSRAELLADGRASEVYASQIATSLLKGGYLESRDLYVE